MQGELYIVNCPQCGKVEGYAPTSVEGRDTGMSQERLIEEETVETPEGTTVRIRCPKCGGWLPADRSVPE